VVIAVVVVVVVVIDHSSSSNCLAYCTCACINSWLFGRAALQ
jgi:hypothetical protein